MQQLHLGKEVMLLDIFKMLVGCIVVGAVLGIVLISVVSHLMTVNERIHALLGFVVGITGAGAIYYGAYIWFGIVLAVAGLTQSMMAVAWINRAKKKVTT